MRFGLALDLVEIDAGVVGAHPVGRRLEPFTGNVWRRAVGQMPARRQRHAEDCVPRRQQREVHRLVRRRPGMRLHIGEAALEEALGALDRQALGDVDEFAAAVVAPPGITFGVFVGQHRALCLQHGARDDVLAGDQLDLRLLAVQFLGDRGGDFGVGGGKVIAKKTRAGRGIGD